MSEIKLNLARKWRSRNFDEIIGQDLSVRMLKNSIYLKQFFPVYLFSGQRGCGKTTTARVFAAALNCEKLELFQKHPQKQIIPCLECISCKAIEKGKHPDFIEIDAASHTGVDNVRYIIDSASLMPLMGRKKVYLIDEAHMLSKAAFNAFLKVLEEPPASVLFILATTDPQKIIETVRSRCFQLFFKPVEQPTLHKQLEMICMKENILYDDAGLDTVIKQAEGSVRDAINLLEQVRFSSKSVSQDAVLKVLGYLDDQLLLTLFDHTLNTNPRTLLQYIKKLQWEQYAPHIIWQRLIELGRAALWLKYGVVPESFAEIHASIRNCISRKSASHLNYFLEQLFNQELIFNRTAAKHDVLEMVLLHICHTLNDNDDEDEDGGGSAPSAMQASSNNDEVEFIDSEEEIDEEDENEDVEDESEQEVLSTLVTQTIPQSYAQKWQEFITNIASLQDPLLNSIFSQGVLKESAPHEQQIIVEFSKEYVFFTNWLQDAEKTWRPLFEKYFGAIALKPEFTGASIKRVKIEQPLQHVVIQQPIQTKQPAIEQKPKEKQSAYYQKRSFLTRKTREVKLFKNEKVIDISDTILWHKTHTLLRYLSGTVTEIQESV